MANTLRINSEAMLLYDIRNPDAAKGFKENRYSLEDWHINNQSVAECWQRLPQLRSIWKGRTTQPLTSSSHPCMVA